MSNRDENTIEHHAREWAREFFENASVGHHDEITTEWLMEKHPELRRDDAEEYRQFCKRNTIVFRDCYGDGQIMWPQWMAFNRRATTHVTGEQ